MHAVWAVAIGLILWLLWLIGLIAIFLWTLWGGCVAVEFFIRFTSTVINLPEKPNPGLPRIPPGLTGVIERLVFLMLVATRLEDIGSAMMGWLAIKLASNWQRYNPENEPSAPMRALLAALAGLISLAFAYLGGVLLRWLLGI
jgi:hypothetical protein